MRTMDDREAANDGGLSGDRISAEDNIRTLDIAGLEEIDLDELRRRWTSVYGVEPLPRLSRELMARALAYCLQERARGGVSKKVWRKLEQIARGPSNRGGAGGGTTSHPQAGTRLMREWQGKLHEVVVLEDGFLWNGGTYPSLSEIARLITGTRWSGPRFFGLRHREVKADG